MPKSISLSKSMYPQLHICGHIYAHIHIDIVNFCSFGQSRQPKKDLRTGTKEKKTCVRVCVRVSHVPGTVLGCALEM